MKKSTWVIGVVSVAIVALVLALLANLLTNPQDGYELERPLPAMSGSMMVYKTDMNLSYDYGKNIKELFGVNQSIKMDEAGSDRWLNQNDQYLDLDGYGGFVYKVPSKCASTRKPDNLPGEQESIEIAKQFLENHDLMPADVRQASIKPTGKIERYSSDRNGGEVSDSYILSWFVFFKGSINNLPVYGGNQQLTVWISDHGEIISVAKNWVNITAYEMKAIKTPDKAYADLVNGDNVIWQTDLPGRKVITNVSLGYRRFVPDDYPGYGEVSQFYFKPIYVLKGYYKNGPAKGCEYEAWVKTI